MKLRKRRVGRIRDELRQWLRSRYGLSLSAEEFDDIISMATEGLMGVADFFAGAE